MLWAPLYELALGIAITKAHSPIFLAHEICSLSALCSDVSSNTLTSFLSDEAPIGS